MIRLGLTGSIATGKSTVSQFFRDIGIPVHDADAAVHAIYKEEGVEPVGALIPTAIVDGVIDRAVLKDELAKSPALFAELEAIVHPLVQAREEKAFNAAAANGDDLFVCDVPLLFETNGDDRMDKILVVHCKPETQMERLLARPGMTKETARMLMNRQMPQAEKMRRADYQISTDHGFDHTRQAVEALIFELRA